jgi:hypothetical protein
MIFKQLQYYCKNLCIQLEAPPLRAAGEDHAIIKLFET